MGDRYIPSRPRRDDRPRHARDNGYEPYDRYDRNERYDRYDRYGGNERFRSPPPRSPPRRRYDDYGAQDGGFTFRGAAARNDDRAPPDQFSFRASGPRFPSPDRHAPPPASRGPQRGGRRGDFAGRGGRARGQNRQPNRRPWRRAPPPSERDILHETGRARTPEQLEGMNVDGQVRFNALASSSEESGGDDNQAARHTSSSEEEGEIRRKRFKVDAPQPKPEVPKWSNPDPYSVLPPTENTGAPKKDIVAQIRKAKNDVKASQDTSQSANQDFISFNFDDDDGGDDADDDKASTGQAEIGDGQTSDRSSVKSFAADGFTPINGNHISNGGAAPSVRSMRLKRDEIQTSHRGNPIDLTGEDSDEDMPPPPSPQRILRSRPFPPARLTGDDDGPPPPPPAGFVMPSDEELMQQYVGQPKGRKRKYDEQSRGKGDITDAWAADWSDPTPWCTTDRSRTADASLRLHEEITDFFEFVRPHQHEEAIRHELIQRVQQAVRGSSIEARTVEIKCFGSFAAGLYLPTADMDLVAVSQHFLGTGRPLYCQKGGKMHNLVRHLVRSGIASADSATAVTRAKVPIVKFTDIKTGIKVDISFENDSGLRANRTFQDWKLQFPDMPVIVVLIKQLLAMRDLNEVFHGGLGGFSIICLVVSMLQLMPDDDYADLTRHGSYGALLLRFLDLYGNQFNLRGTGIMMDPPQYFDKVRYPMAAQNANNLTIMDPNNQNNDISGGSREVHAVFEVFRKAHSQILQRMEKIQAGKDVEDSILGCVLAGNYRSFIQQRNKLFSLYGGTPPSPDPDPISENRPRPQKPAKSKKPLEKDKLRKRQRSPDYQDQPLYDGTLAPPIQDDASRVPRKRLRSLDDNKAPSACKPLESRVQGGPPVNQMYVHPFAHPFQDTLLAAFSADDLEFKVSILTDKPSGASAPPRKQQKTNVDPADSDRAKLLKSQFPQLAFKIPPGLSREQFKQFKKDHEVPNGGSDTRTGNGATRGVVESTNNSGVPNNTAESQAGDGSDDDDDEASLPMSKFQKKEYRKGKDRADTLKQQHPQLSSIVPASLSKEDFQSFKERHNLGPFQPAHVRKPPPPPSAASQAAARADRIAKRTEWKEANPDPVALDVHRDTNHRKMREREKRRPNA